ncbi:plasmid IncI1-type surface exclusion protein ExcA [Salmonella bongori]
MEVMDMIGAYAKRGEALSKREQYVFAAVLLYFIFLSPLLIIFGGVIGWGLAIIPPALYFYLGYKKQKRRGGMVKSIVQYIKNQNSKLFAPEEAYEYKSIPSLYFGIDVKKGTMLYVRFYPNNTMDIIGMNIHNFTRTVVTKNHLEIYTKYVDMPMIEFSIGTDSARALANTMHAMAERSYDYPVDFPRMIQEKRKEWEKVAGIPVAEVF